MELAKESYQKTFIKITIFALVLASGFLLYSFETMQMVRDGLYYRQIIMNKDMLPFWKELAKD